MMNRGKKLLSLLLAVMMLLGMMQTVAFAGVDVVPSNAVITLTPSKTESLKPGDTFTVDVTLANNPGYISAAFNIVFDKTALTATEFTVARGDSFSFGNYATNLNKDYGAFITFASATADTYDGKLFSMSFKVNDDATAGNYSISINKEHEDHLFDYQDAEVNTTFHTWDATYVPASVTVAGANACEHTDTVPSYKRVEGTETHTVTMICANEACGQQVGDAATENCADTDPVDGKCDKCEGAVACKHTNTTESTEYAVANGTHTLVTKVVCDACGETISSSTGESEACSDTDPEDGECDVCGNPVGDHADMNVSSELVTAGDTVQMKISVENDQNEASVYNSYEFVVEYDSAKLTYKDFTCNADENCAVTKKDGKLIINGYGDVKTVSENAFVTLNFVAASVEAETTAVVKLTEAYRDTSAMAIERDIDQIEVETTEKTITIQPTTKEYKVTFSEKVTVNGQTVTEKIVKAGESVIFSVIEKDGKNASVTGAAKNDDGTYTVTPTEDTTVTITYTDKVFDVVISGAGKEDVTGEATATYGKDYNFTVNKNDDYNYTVSATVGGQNVEMTIDGNKYTIAGTDVTGEIKITVTKEAKPGPGPGPGPEPEYVDIHTNTNGASDAPVKQIVKGEEYIYEIPNTHKVYKVTVGGEVINATFDSEGNLHLPAGTTSADVVIYLGEIYDHSAQLADGTSAADAVVLDEEKPSYGTDYTFTVKAGYKLDNVVIGETATAAEGDEPVYTDNGDGTYTVKGTKILGDITIIVHKIEYAKTVDVYPYVKVGGTEDGAAVIQLVVATAGADVAEGEILQYNGQNMFWSSKYNGYAYLVLVGENEELLTKEAAAALIGAAKATATEIGYDGNVNMTTTGVKDVNDAQLVYDIYKAMYSNFDKVSMEKMLRADMNANADKAEATYGLTVNDVLAVMAIVNAK